MSWKLMAITVGLMIVALAIYDFASSKLGHYEED
jgi:hypothetical protein